MSLELKGGVSLANSKPYLIVFAGFVILFALIYATAGRIYNGMIKTINDSKEVEKDVGLLDSKINSLKTIKVDLGSDDVNSLNVAFPEEDKMLFLFSQLKELAKNDGVTLTNIDFTTPSVQEGDLSRSVINLSISGVKTSVESFMSSVAAIAPLAGIGPVNFSNVTTEEGLFVVNASVETYFSPLPKNLPSQSSYISVLTDDEKQTLNTLKSLKVLSVYVSQAKPADESAVNPFNEEETQPVPTPAQ